MARRTLAVALGLLAACGGEPAALTPGAPVPAGWQARGAPGRPAVVWVFRTEDCLSCQSLDYSLRRLQRTRGDRVSLVAVHVGRTADAGIPAAFFASRRVRTSAAIDVTPRRFRRQFGDVTLPALLLVRGDTIVWSSTAPGQPRLTLARIDSLFASTLAGVAGPGRTAAPE